MSKRKKGSNILSEVLLQKPTSISNDEVVLEIPIVSEDSEVSDLHQPIWAVFTNGGLVFSNLVYSEAQNICDSHFELDPIICTSKAIKKFSKE